MLMKLWQKMNLEMKIRCKNIKTSLKDNSSTSKKALNVQMKVPNKRERMYQHIKVSKDLILAKISYRIHTVKLDADSVEHLLERI